LESYFKCPFQNFLSGGLRLKEREEATVLAVDSGNFIHTVLERVGQELKKSEPVIKSEDDARAFAKELGEKLVCDPLYKAQLDTKAGKYASDNLVLEGVEAAAAVYRQIAGSFYQVQQTEVDVKTQDFHGKIDRVDVSDGEDNKFVRIVDYKTGHIDDKPIAYYTGRHLQMQLYMSAVKGERTPAGVFYFPASLSFKSDGGVNFKMAGFLNGDEAAIRAGDKELEAGKVSDFFGAALGSNSSRMAVMDGETFSYFLDYAVLEARQGTKELKGGFIAPTPYEGVCDWCKYGGICGFNKDKQKPRSEKAIKPKQIADIVKKAQEGQED
jgi:ATP-dependent helicase/nuclease subunit B